MKEKRIHKNNIRSFSFLSNVIRKIKKNKKKQKEKLFFIYKYMERVEKTFYIARKKRAIQK